MLRNRVLRGRLPTVAALSALAGFASLPVERFPHTALLPRAFELRDNASLHDALYLALAEMLEVRMPTRDKRLAAVPGVGTRIEVIV